VSQPNFIRTALDVVQTIIERDTPALLAAMNKPRDPFRQVGRAYTGQLPNPPAAWVMPRTTAFASEGQLISQADLITVKIGIVGAEPEAIADAALDYVKAVDLALRNAAAGELDATVMRIYVVQHDYGPLFGGAAGGFARFPEVHLQVERVEVPS
jgi:hypothetical protein